MNLFVIMVALKLRSLYYAPLRIIIIYLFFFISGPLTAHTVLIYCHMYLSNIYDLNYLTMYTSYPRGQARWIRCLRLK